MKWFNNPKSLEELKKQYKKLACKHHPDISGGSEKDMKEINAEYDLLFSKLKNVHENVKGETYTSKEETTETPDEFKDIINNKPGFVKAMWCGDRACEDKIKEDVQATSRCIPFVQEQLSDKCVCCGKLAKKMVYWGRAY